jgi:ankyrin repeat protein
VKALVAAGASLDFSQCEYGSPLQAAVSRNRESVSQYLLDIGADINARGGRLGTALQAASWVGDHKMVSTLLAAGAHTTSGGSCFGGPLGAAMSRQHKAIVDLLLTHGCKAEEEGAIDYNWHWLYRLYRENNLYPPEMVDVCFRTPLDWAVFQSDIEMVEKLFRVGADPNKIPERCNLSPIERDRTQKRHALCTAISARDHKIVQTILVHWADVGIGGCCPLICAAGAGDIKIFRTLFEHLPRSCDKKLLTAEVLESCSCEAEFLHDLLQLLESKTLEAEPGARGILIARAAAVGSTTLLRYYFGKGWNVNTRPAAYGVGDRTLSSHGAPLLSAVRNRQKEVIDLLLDHGVDPNISSESDGTALLAAVKVSDVELLKRLLCVGAETDSEIRLHETCGKIIHHAASENEPELLEVLIDHGADITAQCELCPNTLMAAVNAENVQGIQLLVDRGLDVNQGDWYGCTPLFRASNSFLDASAKTLLELGGQMHLPQAEVNRQIQDTVRRLCHVLLQMLKTTLEQDSNDRWLGFQRWVLLGRALLLGNDELNGIIALEQCGYKWPGERDFESNLSCQICRLHQFGTHHFCKEGLGAGICARCTEKHWNSLGDAKSTHESVQYPRSLYFDIPEHCVALDEGNYITRIEWLENIIATWHIKPTTESRTRDQRTDASYPAGLGHAQEGA